LKYGILKPNPSPEFRLAVRRFEAGLYEMADAQFLAPLTTDPNDIDSFHFLRLIQRRLAKTSLPRSRC
jgi:hypothetical protein